MKKGFFLIVNILLVLAVVSCHSDDDAPSQEPQDPSIKTSRNRMVVRFDDSWSEQKKNELRGEGDDSEFKLTAPPETCGCGDSNIEIWTIDTTATDTNIERARRRLNRDRGGEKVKGDIDFAITIPVDVPKLEGQVTVPPIGNLGNDVIVAVIDTGLDWGFDDAPAYILNTDGKACSGTTGGWDFINNRAEFSDGHGHGTYVTKIIRDILEAEGIGYKILPLKAFDNAGNGSYADIVCAMGYIKKIKAAGQKIDIVNASFGGTMTVEDFENETLLSQLIQELGEETLVVASAGNESKEVDASNIRHFPSGFNGQNILGVGGYILDSEEIQIHPDSNRGTTSIDVATLFEPYSLTFTNGSFSEVIPNLRGTSYGAAYISGIAAKEKGNNMGITNLKNHVLNLATNNSNLNAFIRNGLVLEHPLTP